MYRDRTNLDPKFFRTEYRTHVNWYEAIAPWRIKFLSVPANEIIYIFSLKNMQ